MRLKIRDVAELFGVPERTIYRWIAQRNLPAHRVVGQYRFNRAELIEWATAERMAVTPKMLDEGEDATPASLERALRTGGIHYRVGGSDKSSVLRSVVDILPLPREVDRAFLLQVLLAREAAGSTGVGDGIAIPHVRNPVVLHVEEPIVALSFLEQSIDFGAIDAKPVHTLFTIVSPTTRSHLSLLSKLAHGLRGSSFADAVAQQASRDLILAAAAELEARIATGVNRAGAPPP